MRLSLSLFVLLLSCSLLNAQQSEPAGAAPQPTAPAGQQGDAAAQPNPQNTIQVNSRLVILDAVAIDKQGNIVRDLRKDEWHLFELSEPQQIRAFYGTGHFTPPPTANIASTADLDRTAKEAPVNIVVLDEFNTLFEDMAFARYSLKKWLERQPDKLATPTMLCSVDLQHFNVLRDYTQNKQELIDALDHHFAAYPWQAHQFAWVAERYATAFLTLNRVAEASLGHHGHKNIIWIGRGLPTVNRAGFSPADNQQVNRAVMRTVNQLRDARVTLYTIDPAGVMTDPGRYGSAAQDFAPFGGDPDFDALARATGGRNLHGRNDVDAEIGTAIRDGSDVYSFSYRPTTNFDDLTRFHKIRVTVDRPGVTILTREGYYPDLRAARPDAEGRASRVLASELLSASTSNMSYDAVHFTVHSTVEAPNEFKLRLDPETLVWYHKDADPTERYTNVIIVVTTYDKKGKQMSSDAKRVRAEAPRDAVGGAQKKVAVNLPYSLAPNPKAVRARFVVRMEGNGRMGTADVIVGQAAETSSYGAVAAPAAPVAPTSAPTVNP